MIRDMHRKGVSISEIARQTGRDPKTIRKIIQAGSKPGGDVTRLSQIMGHSSITTTAIYAVFDDDELAEAHDEFSPMKHLKLND